VGRNRRGRLASSQKPANLPPAALMGLVRRTVPPFALSHTQLRREMEVSAQTFIV